MRGEQGDAGADGRADEAVAARGSVRGPADLTPVRDGVDGGADDGELTDDRAAVFVPADQLRAEQGRGDRGGRRGRHPERALPLGHAAR